MAVLIENSHILKTLPYVLYTYTSWSTEQAPRRRSYSRTEFSTRPGRAPWYGQVMRQPYRVSLVCERGRRVRAPFQPQRLVVAGCRVTVSGATVVKVVRLEEACRNGTQTSHRSREE